MSSRIYCISCKHYEYITSAQVGHYKPGFSAEDHLHRCNGVADLVTGRPRTDTLCRDCRSASGPCGPTGTLYIHKEPK